MNHDENHPDFIAAERASGYALTNRERHIALHYWNARAMQPFKDKLCEVRTPEANTNCNKPAVTKCKPPGADQAHYLCADCFKAIKKFNLKVQHDKTP